MQQKVPSITNRILQTGPLIEHIKATSFDMKDRIVDFILPPVCLNCHHPLSQSYQLCAPCWQGINFISKPYCQINGTPLPFDLGPEAVSAQAIANPPLYDKARSVAHYSGTMRSLIHKLKYQDRHELITLMANWLKIAGQSLIKECDVIIPIPLHRSKLWQRRFNQSSLISLRLSEITNKPINLISLKRRKKTKSQVGLSKNARQENLAGAFINSNDQIKLIQNKIILLIDDVITTGSTANSATKVLKKAGAKKVLLLSLANTNLSTDNYHNSNKLICNN